MKLVNSLLEFSRIEAGRIEAAYEPADLATLTADLASVFRSAFERAGVKLEIDCPPLPEPVFVDSDMWEKIVLNLISNAFKFTLYGRGARLAARRWRSMSSWRLPTPDVASPRRTFRGCSNASSADARRSRVRTKAPESGLSLVQELVKLHGGTVQARQSAGSGNELHRAYPARLPAPAARPDRRRAQARSSRHRCPAVRRRGPGMAAEFRPRYAAAQPATPIEHGSRPERDSPAASARILVVDDNADMRDYLGRLLGKQWQVDTATDSSVALEQIARSVSGSGHRRHHDARDRRIRAPAAAARQPALQCDCPSCC